MGYIMCEIYINNKGGGLLNVHLEVTVRKALQGQWTLIFMQKGQMWSKGGIDLGL